MSDLVLEDIRSGGSPSKILRKVFIKRLHANPSYSVRKFAKDLGMGQTLLNHVFSGKRGVSCSQGIRLAPRLGLRSPEKEEWLRVVLASLPKKAKERQRLEAALNGVVPEEMEFLTSAYERVEGKSSSASIVGDWYHWAIMDLTLVRGFKSDPEWIARRLSIPVRQARSAVQRLLEAGLLKKVDGKLRKTHLHLNYPSDPKTRAGFREFYRQMCEKTVEELKKTDALSFERRRITGICFAIRSDRIPKAIEKIERFKIEMADLLCDQSADSVYYMGLQLIPLTKGPNSKDASWK